MYDKDFKKTVFEIAPNGNKLISPNTTQNPTRLWRSLKEDVISSKIQYNLDLKGEKIQVKLNLEVLLLINKETLKLTIIELLTEG